MSDEQEVLFDPSVADNHDATYVDPDGTIIYRASSLGRCIRGLVASRLGITPIPPSDHMQAIFDAGHRSETMIEDKLREAGWLELGRQQEIVFMKWMARGIEIRGHIDAVGTDRNTKRWLMEYKSFSVDHYEKFKNREMNLVVDYPAYAYQTSIYGLAMNLPVMFVVGKREEDGTISEVTTREVPNPLIGLGGVWDRVDEIERLVKKGEYPACAVKKDYPCPFVHIHDEDDVMEVEDEEFDDWAMKWQVANGLEKIYKAEKDMAKEMLTKLCDQHGVTGGKINTTRWEITDVVSSSKRLDRGLLSKAFGDLSAYEKESKSRYVKVKERDDGGKKDDKEAS